MKSVCVFLGSSSGHRPEFASATRELGTELADRGLHVVYGGGDVGLMGLLADAVLEAGGRVTGVIPGFLADREVAHTGLTTLHVVNSMHERKAKMAALSDAFITLPGGLGTLEEFFEVLTWAQLGLHTKPCGLLDIAGYWTPMRDLMEKMATEGFLGTSNQVALEIESTVPALLSRLGILPSADD